MAETFGLKIDCEVNKRLGGKVKELRMPYGLSQERLAEHLDISLNNFRSVSVALTE
jgi:DNA-binding XRE family transcriptional regulator